MIKQYKSVIIDMYSYDASMSKHTIDYIPKNVFKYLIHNFKKNKNYKNIVV